MVPPKIWGGGRPPLNILRSSVTGCVWMYEVSKKVSTRNSLFWNGGFLVKKGEFFCREERSIHVYVIHHISDSKDREKSEKIYGRWLKKIIRNFRRQNGNFVLKKVVRNFRRQNGNFVLKRSLKKLGLQNFYLPPQTRRQVSAYGPN